MQWKSNWLTSDYRYSTLTSARYWTAREVEYKGEKLERWDKK